MTTTISNTNGQDDAQVLRKKIVAITRVENNQQIILTMDDQTKLEFSSPTGITVRLILP